MPAKAHMLALVDAANTYKPMYASILCMLYGHTINAQ